MIGAAMPMLSYEGVSARPMVPAVIRPMVSSIAGLRPARSAKAPISTPPSGRVMKPTPNTATESSRLVNGELDGKKVLPIYTAKNA